MDNLPDGYTLIGQPDSAPATAGIKRPTVKDPGAPPTGYSIVRPTAQPDVSQPPDAANSTIGLMDVPKELAAGAVRGAGEAVSGIGSLGQMIARPIVAGVNAIRPDTLSEPVNAFEPVGNAISKGGDWIADTETDAAKAKKALPIFTGDITRPDSWHLGDGATSPGALALGGAGLLGAMAPMFAGGVEARGAKAAADIVKGAADELPGVLAKIKAGTALTDREQQIAGAVQDVNAAAKRAHGASAALGGMQMAQGSAEGEKARIEQMPQEDLDKLPEYQQRLAQNMTPDQARADLAEKSAANTFAATLPVTAAMGYAGVAPALQRDSGIIAKLAGDTSRARRVAVGAGLEAPLQAGLAVGQNAAQIAAANASTGESRDLTENSAGMAGTGAAMGLGFGALAGLHRPGAAPPPVPHPDAVPGSLSDAANTIPRPTAATAPVAPVAPNIDPNAGPISRAAAQVTPVHQAEVVAAGAEPAPAPTQTAPEQATLAATTTEPARQPPKVPWIDAQTGEQRPATDDEIKFQFHRMFDAARDSGASMGSTAASRGLADEWGIPQARLKALRKDAVQDRRNGVTTDQAAQMATDSLRHEADVQAAHDEFRNEPTAPEPAPLPTPTENTDHATDTRQEPTSVPEEHPAGDQGGETAETGGGDRVQPAPPVEPEGEQGPVEAAAALPVEQNVPRLPPEPEREPVAAAPPRAEPEPQDADTAKVLADKQAHEARVADLDKRVMGLDDDQAIAALHSIDPKLGADLGSGATPQELLRDQHPDDIEDALSKIAPAETPANEPTKPAVDTNAIRGVENSRVGGADQAAPSAVEGATGPAAVEPPKPAEAAKVETAARDAAMHPENPRPDPTEAQREAGNYAKGHVNLHGLDISIENPGGTSRRPEWPPLKNHYGYIRRTEGADGEHVDVFLGDHAHDAARPVFVVDQFDPKTRKFDEHKVILGAKTGREARKMYEANYSKGWKGFGGIHKMSIDEFKDWLKNGDTTRPATDAIHTTDTGKKPEPATPDIVGAAAKAAAPKIDMRAARLSLLKQIDEALSKAPPGEEGDNLLTKYEPVAAAVRLFMSENKITNFADAKQQMIEQRGGLLAKKYGYVTLDVPGDGKFKVVNSKLRLADFRKQVEAQFKNRGLAPVREGHPESRSLRLTDEQRKAILAEGEAHEPEQVAAPPGFPSGGLYAVDREGSKLFRDSAKPGDQSLDRWLELNDGIRTNSKNAYIATRKGADGRFRIVVRGSGRDMAPGETFTSSPEAKRWLDALGARYDSTRKGDTFDAKWDALPIERREQVLKQGWNAQTARRLAAKAWADHSENTRKLIEKYAGTDAGKLVMDAPQQKAQDPSDQKAAVEKTEQPKATNPASAGSDAIAHTAMATFMDTKSGDLFVNLPADRTDLAAQTLRDIGIPFKRRTGGLRVPKRNAADARRALPTSIERFPNASIETFDDGRVRLNAKQGTFPHASRQEAIHSFVKNYGAGEAERTFGSAALRAAEPEPDEAQTPPATKELKDDHAAPGFAAVEKHAKMMRGLRNGSVTLEDYKDGWKRLQENKEAIRSHLNAMTKEQLLKEFGAINGRASDSKADLVDRAWLDMESDFQIGRSLSYRVDFSSRDAAGEARRAQVERTTQSDLDAYAKSVADNRAMATKRIEGAKNPQTLSDFQSAARIAGGEKNLTPEQRARFDQLRVEDGAKQREEAAARAAVVHQVDTGDIGMKLVETKHTQKGHDLFVVQMADRVEREVYDKLNVAARRLGGNYSSYRGNGAVPGFQFRSRADAEQFMALRNSDQSAAARQAARAEAETENRAETLGEKAAKVREAAQKSLNRERKENTARRAAMAASAETDARRALAQAETMDRIAKAQTAGTAGLLDHVAHRSQVALLERTLSSNHWDVQRAAGTDWEKALAAPYKPEDLTNTTLPKFWLHLGDAVRMVKSLAARRGGKALGEALAEHTDYAPEYAKAVQKEPRKFLFTTADGGDAVFKTKREATAVLEKSRVHGEVLKFGDGAWGVVPHPDAAIERKLWTPDYDKRVAVSPDFANKVMDLVGKDRGNGSMPYWWEAARDTRAAFERMGITKDFELREALRKYLELRAPPEEENAVRKMERDLAGRNDVGVDFFPTPPDVVSRLIDQADIGPGMHVLEPSAGKGDIAEALRDAADGVKVDTVEQSHQLHELLNAKGFDNEQGDFLAKPAEPKYDRIVMNPPFGKDNGAAHVQHAYDMLKPGGRLVAVMGEGSRGKDEFGQWLEKVGGTEESLPEGSFKSSFRPTGVRTKVVVVDKPATGGAEARAGMFRHDDATNAPAFKRYFEGSKVTNADGTPRIVYHGTSEGFHEFQDKRLGESTGHMTAPLGHYFTEQRAEAEGYARKAADGVPADERVIEAYLSIKNPASMSLKQFLAIDSQDEARALRAKFEREGHDGIRFDANGKTQWIAFDSRQVKDVNNRGTFDRNNPDIRFRSGDTGAKADTGTATAIRRALSEAHDRLGSNAPDARFLSREQWLAQAPESARADPRWKDAKGFIDGAGKVTVIADNHRNVDDALRTFAHETVGHYGVDRIIDEHAKGGWSRVITDTERLRALAKDGNSALSPKIREAVSLTERRNFDKKNNKPADPQTFAKEFLAVMAEKGMRNGIVDRAIAAVRAWVRKVFPSLKFEQRDLLRLLQKSDEYLHAGAREDAARRAAVHAMAFSHGDSDIRSTQIPRAAGDTASVWRNDQPLKHDPDYKGAKAGDPEAAARLVARHAGPLTEQAAQRFGKDVTYVAAHAEEVSGRNQIPQALARYLADKTGAAKETDMVQTNRAFHTGADQMERMIARSQFDGPVEKGRKYVLVDDVTTMGGTLADLAHYVQSKGGEVVGTATLVNAARDGGKLHAAPALLRQLERRYGDAIREQTGIDPAALTASEARYLVGFRTADELRNRAAAARVETGRRLLSKGIRLETGIADHGVDSAPRAETESDAQSESGKFRHADDKGDDFSDFDPSRPTASMEHLGKTFAKPDNNGLFDAAKNWVRGKWENFRPAALGALTRRQIGELIDSHPALKGYGKQYDERVQKLEADRTQMISGAHDAAEHPGNMLKKGAAAIADSLRKFAHQKGLAGWLGRKNPETKALADVMHMATIHGIDPSEEYTRLQMDDGTGKYMPWTPQSVKERIAALRGQMRGRPGDDKRVMMDEVKALRALKYREAARTRAWPELKAAFQKLSPEAKELYRQQRDWYAQMRDENEKALIARIEAVGRDMGGAVGDDLRRKYVQQMTQRIRLQFESLRREGVYFPLNRDGDFFIAYSDKTGAQGFNMYESAAEAAAAERKLRGDGFKIDVVGRRDGNYKAKSAPPGTFVADVIGIMKKSGAPEKAQDEVYQAFLRTLPDVSMRKHSIHRKAVPGYSEDILRNFSKNAFHGAHQLARLHHAHELTAILDAAHMSMDNYRRADELSAAGAPGLMEVSRGDALLGELDKRHDSIMSPTDAQLANHLNAIGFLYHIGASPASALANLTQNAQTTLPVLGAQHGFGKAAKALGAAMRDSMRTGGHIERTLTRDDERKAHAVLQSRGDINKTQAHTLAALAEGNELKSHPAWEKFMGAMTWMFHTAEVVNRESAGMAAYRLARSRGDSFDQAVQYASDIINGTHFDYTSANRPRYMQGNVGRIVFQFKNWSQQMTWMMYRNLHQAFNGETPEVRRAALRTFTGIMGTTAMMAGTMGLPMYNAVKWTAEAADSLFGDGTPFDFDTEYQKWLADNLGTTAGKYVAGGAVNQLTGAALSTRTSLSDLWWRDADRELEGKDAYYNYLDALVGPIGGITKNLFVGSKQIADGNMERGVETLLPNFVKNPIKALRYEAQGVNTLRGDPIVSDITRPEEIIQALGFQPTRVFEQQQQNSALLNYSDQITTQRARLMNAYALAAKAGVDTDRAMEKIHDFNRLYPEIAINSNSIRQSMRARARYSAEAAGGVALNRKLANRLRESVGVQPQAQ